MNQDQWVVEFDYRADNGPRLVGPFSDRPAAWKWLSELGLDSEAMCAPLASPSRTEGST